jgi:pimeloyl-ACP methyl ester carboxylesterase
MPFVDIGPGKMYYADQRQADALRPPLLLIHGAGATHFDFPPSLQALHSIAPDLPGHGQSDPPSFHRVEDYAEAIASFIDALNLPEVYLMGHSMGGAISQLLALTMPERVRGLILLATGAHLPVSPTLLTGLKEKVVETLGLIVKWEWAKDVPQDWRAQSLKTLLQMPPQVIFGDYFACSQFDVRPRLAQLSMPVLLLGHRRIV